MGYTPGPWKWYWKINDRLEADCGVYSENIPGQAVSICRAPRYEKEEQWEANARLIAATPELLEFCHEIALEPYKDSNLKSLLETYQVRAKILIAKAENR